MSSTELKAISFIIGHWRTEGSTVVLPGRPAESIAGVDTYEWVLDGKFILHRADVMMGENHTQVIELIGACNNASESCKLWSFDNAGAVTLMDGSMEEDILTIRHKKMRSTLTFSKKNDSMSADWEISEDGSNWLPWMQLKFTRI
jgi:hypothetical protein